MWITQKKYFNRFYNARGHNRLIINRHNFLKANKTEQKMNKSEQKLNKTGHFWYRVFKKKTHCLHDVYTDIKEQC
jgi:hypothetical protein